jgi:hypothetical protein
LPIAKKIAAKNLLKCVSPADPSCAAWDKICREMGGELAVAVKFFFANGAVGAALGEFLKKPTIWHANC